MLFPSTGFTCGTFCSNDGILTSGRMITVPEICAGSRDWISFSSAMMDAYSVPCEPETSASTGPGFAPRNTATGIEAVASGPAGTSIVPNAFCPGPAVAVPTVNVCAAAIEVARQTINIANRRVFMAAESIGGMFGKVEQGRGIPGSMTAIEILQQLRTGMIALKRNPCRELRLEH